MRHKIQIKLISLILVFAMLVSVCPVVYAQEAPAEDPQAAVQIQEEDPSETEETTAPTEETEEATEPTEAEEPTEATEATEPTEATEAAEPEEPTEPSAEPTEPTEVTEPTEATEATEPTEEAEEFSFLGLPEGYTLSEQALKEKADMSGDEFIRDLDRLECGVDYEEDTLVIHAEDEEEAKLFAQAYCAELVDYAYGTGLIRLEGASVKQAVEAAMDPELALPAVSPNYIVVVEPQPENVSVDRDAVTMMASTPQRMDWDAWVNQVMTNPDPALLSPAGNYNGRYAYWNDGYQYMHDVVDSYAAWGVTAGYGVTVAVIDTGVNGSHPDLAGKVSYVDIGLGTRDDVGHGTAVAGIIAATMDNGRGGAGIAPYARILSIRVSGSNGSTSDYYIARGIRAAMAQGADVINLSLGGPTINQDLWNAVRDAQARGICVVASMGNDGMTQVNYPAACAGVIAVVATDANNTRAQYSNYGSWADVAAPGTDLVTTSEDGGYMLFSGTSAATPVVAGVAALYKSVHVEATPSQIEARMKKTAVKAGSDTGAGIVNAAAMLSEKPGAPVLEAYDSRGNSLGDTYYATLGSHVPCESTLRFWPVNDDQNYFLLYTLDGKVPSVKNGEVVNGEIYDWNGIDLSGYAGKTITVRVMQVNGMGMVGTVTTKKLTVDKTVNIERVVISGPQFLIAGKKGEYTAVVEPEDKASQEVYWTILPGEDTKEYTFARGVSINQKNGQLTTSKNSWGLVQIVAISKIDSSKMGGYVSFVMPMNAVANITLNYTKASCFIGGTVPLRVQYALNANKNVMDLDYLTFRWTSSNPKVATVDENGVVTAVAKGSAVITCKALDGSGKSSKCTVTVKQPVTELDITGQSSIEPGGSAVYKATAMPTTANDKTVTWSLYNAPWGVTIDKSGRVKVASYTPRGRQFLVIATARDGSGESVGYIVTVRDRCTGVSLWYEDAPGKAPGVTVSRGKLTSVGLFNVDLKNANGYPENEIQLTATPVGSRDVDIAWTSSKSDVASVDRNGLVTAHKAGTTVITATAQDGSKKKASVTIKVTVPVSSMTLTSSAPKGDRDMSVLAVGRSYSHTVSFGKLYGTPTNKKVTWSWQGYTENSRSEMVDITYMLEGYFTCSGGKLTAKKNAADALRALGSVYVTIFAESQDGTHVVASKSYQVLYPTTVLKWYGGYEYDSSVGMYYYTFYSDQYHANSSSGYTYSNFTVTSSKPEVINPIGVVSTGYSSWLGGYVYRLYFDLGVHGKSKITVTATDGTNKTINRTLTYS